MPRLDKTALLLGFLLAGTFLQAAPTQADRPVFARCTGAIDGLPIRLEFAAPALSPGQPGTMNLFLGDHPEAIDHNLNVLADDENGTKVEVFTALEPEYRFAVITIPRARKSRVVIYAEQWRANWATVDCER